MHARVKRVSVCVKYFCLKDQGNERIRSVNAENYCNWWMWNVTGRISYSGTLIRSHFLRTITIIGRKATETQISSLLSSVFSFLSNIANCFIAV